jgi:hypothetical protein
MTCPWSLIDRREDSFLKWKWGLISRECFLWPSTFWLKLSIFNDNVHRYCTIYTSNIQFRVERRKKKKQEKEREKQGERERDIYIQWIVTNCWLFMFASV